MGINPEDSIRHIYEQVHQANIQLYFVWKDEVLFTWRWWLSVFLCLFSWGAWILFRKKVSTGRLLCAGFLALILCSWCDFLGVSLGLWYYQMDLIPTIPAYIEYDFCFIPVSVMFLLQIQPRLHPLLKACIFSGVISFVVEPVFVWLHFYSPLHWKHVYSFVPYFAIYLVSHYVSRAKKFEDI